MYAGLAITSHDNTVLSTGTVDNYTFTGGALPVKLLTFNAALNFSQKVDLTWSTTEEMRTSYFVIERSKGDNYFTAIDSVKAVNNGRFTTTYHSTDNFPLSGNNFYRLKIVDVDGHATYSAYVMVRLRDSKAPLVYPNPAKTFINIAQGSEPVKFVTIYDISGKAMVRLNNKATSNITQMAIGNLLRGTYVVEIITATNVYRDKLLIQ